jgi:hypothetical protein
MRQIVAKLASARVQSGVARLVGLAARAHFYNSPQTLSFPYPFEGNPA